MSAAVPLRLERVAKRFGGLLVFQDISFELRPGEILGVIGPNGAGKTTLINVIAGGLPPSSGKVFLGNDDVTGKPMHAMSRLGVVRSFQQTNIFRQASVRENLSRAIRFRGGGPAAWQHIAGLLEMLGLAQRLDDQSESLPYGLQKMLGLIMAYATGPRVLLLDEPAAGLERHERQRIDELVRHAREKLGSAVLIVEHDMELIRRICPYIVVIEAGRVLAAGAPQEVLSRPEVIKAYLGESEGEAG